MLGSHAKVGRMQLEQDLLSRHMPPLKYSKTILNTAIHNSVIAASCMSMQALHVDTGLMMKANLCADTCVQFHTWCFGLRELHKVWQQQLQHRVLDRWISY